MLLLDQRPGKTLVIRIDFTKLMVNFCWEKKPNPEHREVQQFFTYDITTSKFSKPKYYILQATLLRNWKVNSGDFLWFCCPYFFFEQTLLKLFLIVPVQFHWAKNQKPVCLLVGQSFSLVSGYGGVRARVVLRLVCADF